MHQTTLLLGISGMHTTSTHLLKMFIDRIQTFSLDIIQFGVINTVLMHFNAASQQFAQNKAKGRTEKCPNMRRLSAGSTDTVAAAVRALCRPGKTCHRVRLFTTPTQQNTSALKTNTPMLSDATCNHANLYTFFQPNQHEYINF